MAYLACGEEVLLRQAYDQEQTLPAQVTSGIQEGGLSLFFSPGTQFAYLNIGYDLLGELLEKVTQVPFLQLVDDLFSSLSSSQKIF